MNPKKLIFYLNIMYIIIGKIFLNKILTLRGISIIEFVVIYVGLKSRKKQKAEVNASKVRIRKKGYKVYSMSL